MLVLARVLTAGELESLRHDTNTTVTVAEPVASNAESTTQAPRELAVGALRGATRLGILITTGGTH